MDDELHSSLLALGLKRSLPLSDRDGSGCRLPFEHWGLVACCKIGMDPRTVTHLALALTDSRLDEAARAALSAHRGATGRNP